MPRTLSQWPGHSLAHRTEQEATLFFLEVFERSISSLCATLIFMQKLQCEKSKYNLNIVNTNLPESFANLVTFLGHPES